MNDRRSDDIGEKLIFESVERCDREHRQRITAKDAMALDACVDVFGLSGNVLGIAVQKREEKSLLFIWIAHVFAKIFQHAKRSNTFST